MEHKCVAACRGVSTCTYWLEEEVRETFDSEIKVASMQNISIDFMCVAIMCDVMSRVMYTTSFYVLLVAVIAFLDKFSSFSVHTRHSPSS